MKHFFVSLYLFTAIQGFILFLAILKQRYRNKPAFTILLVFHFILILTLIGRYLYLSKIITIKTALIPDLVIYLYGPLLYLFFLSFFKVRELRKTDLIHFILPFMYVIICIRLLVWYNSELTNNLFNNYLQSFFFYVESTALLSNLSYFILVSFKLKQYVNKLRNELSYQLIPTYFYILFYSVGLIFFFWTLGYVSKYLGSHQLEIFGYFNIWLLITLTTFTLTYITMFRIETIEIPKNLQKTSPSKKLISLSKDLVTAIEENKYYREPDLTKFSLSKRVKISSSDISKIVNEIYGKNFYDFINEFRIKEFLFLVNKSSHKNYNYFAIAEEVGFKSRATFYNFFKKHYNTTPTEYLKQHKN